MTPEQKKHEEEYLAAKKRYETAYANKVKYAREQNTASTRKQQLISSINAKKSELKKVSQTYDDLLKANGKGSNIDANTKKSTKALADAATQFKAMGESSGGNLKDLEVVFSSSVSKFNRHISDAFSEIDKAKKSLSGRKTKLKSEISKLQDELETLKSNGSKYASLISEAESTMKTASVDMAYHKKFMTV